MGTAKSLKRLAKGPPKEYERIIQKLEADIRGHIRLEHEMKIHMDYLEAKVEKFEKEQKQLEEEKKQTAKKISQLQEKINLFKTDRDDQAKQTKKLKIRLDEMKKISQQLERDNDHLKVQLESSVLMNQSQATYTLPSQPTTVATKQKFNSIDVGFDEQQFNKVIHKNVQSNVNIASHQKLANQQTTQQLINQQTI